MPPGNPSLKAMAREAKDKKKVASTKPKKTSKSPVAINFKSAEFVQESDEEEEEVNNEGQSEDESDSDDDSLPENPTEIATNTAKLPAPSGSSSSSENESSSESSESEEEEEEEEEDSAPEATVQAQPSRPQNKESNPRIVSFAKPSFTAPPGFESTSIADDSRASQLLKKSNLKGKQIWYFTAPSSVPVSEIKQMSMADADAGKAILSYDGGNYGFVKDSTGDMNYIQIMTPSSSNDAYLAVSKSIDRVLHLQRIVKLPGINDGDANATPSSQATVPAKKPVRQQPKGLRMRFRPIGFGTGKLGKIGSVSSDGEESDEEIEDAPPVFQRPVLEEPAIEAASSSSDEEMEDAPPIKPKKSKISDVHAKSSPLKRKHVDDQPAMKSSSQPINTLDSNQLKKKKKKQKKSHLNTAESPSASIETNGTSTKPLLKTAKHVQMSSPIVPNKSYHSSVTVSQEPRSPSPKHSNEHSSQDAEKTPGKKDDVSLHELTKATDPNLTGEERRKKIKKLKHRSGR